MRKKQNITRRFYFESDVSEQALKENDTFNFSEFDSLRKFTGTHPLVMQKRIASKNWQVELDISKKKFTFKNIILFWIEKKTGKRPFEFRNYRKIKL